MYIPHTTLQSHTEEAWHGSMPFFHSEPGKRDDVLLSWVRSLLPYFGSRYLLPSLAVDELMRMFQDREGDLWIGTTRGLQRWRTGVFGRYPVAAQARTGNLGPIFADTDGRIWFGPADGGLYSLVNGRVDRTGPPDLGRDIVYSIAGLGADLWVGRQRGGLTHLHGDGLASSSRTFTEADGLAQNSVYVVQETRDGTIWAGTLSAAAAIYGASEGLSTLVIEGVAPGGQAGTSSKIENYLGFPTGVSGQELANRAQAQAQKFGARLAIARNVTAIGQVNDLHVLTLAGGSPVQSKAVVIATGALYRKLTLALDKNGFILTGAPNSFEDSRYATNVPGIYAVGDVRSDSVKRVAAAVGEGSVVISDVHRYLARQAETFTGGAVGQAAPSTRDAPQLSQRSTPERNLLLRRANIAIFRENSPALVSLPSNSLLYESEAQAAGPVRIQTPGVFESICIVQ